MSFDNVLSYVIIQNCQKKIYNLGVHTTRPIRSSGKRWTREGADIGSGGKGLGEGQEAVQRTGGWVSGMAEIRFTVKESLLKKLKEVRDSARKDRKDLPDTVGRRLYVGGKGR